MARASTWGIQQGSDIQRLTDTPILTLTYADLTVQNEQSYEFTVRTLSAKEDENARSDTVRATPRAFRDDAEFLEYLQQAAFDYFWFEANPANGLVRDRSPPDSLETIEAILCLVARRVGEPGRVYSLALRKASRRPAALPRALGRPLMQADGALCVPGLSAISELRPCRPCSW